jgi:hypothetical protein
MAALRQSSKPECIRSLTKGETIVKAIRRKHRSFWIDDMSASMVTSEGDADADGKVITLGGDYACALTGDKHKQAKQVYRIISRDKHVFEMHDPSKGENSKEMEIAYTRK